MFVQNSSDMAIHADYVRRRAEAYAAHRALKSQIARSSAPHAPLAELRRGLGRRLIVVGERLAGPAAPRPATPCPA